MASDCVIDDFCTTFSCEESGNDFWIGKMSGNRTYGGAWIWNGTVSMTNTCACDVGVDYENGSMNESDCEKRI